MQIPSTLLAASAAALLGSATACSSEQVKAPKDDSKAKGATVAPPEKAAAPAAVPPAPGYHAVLVEVDEKSIVWMSHRDGTIGVYPTESLWTGGGVAIAESSGFRVVDADGTTWWQPSAPALRPATNIAEAFAAGGPPPQGYTVTVDEVKSGMKRIWVETTAGRRDRLGIYATAPTKQSWLTATPLSRGGKASAELKVGAGLTLEADGGLSNSPPPGAVAIARKAPADADLKRWLTDLAIYRTAAVKPTWSTMLDLDQDGIDEGAICVTGGAGDFSCFVVDPLGGEQRYFGLAMAFAGGADSSAPQAFRQADGVYLMRADAAADQKVAGTIGRYDGSSFASDQVNRAGAAGATPPAPRTAAGQKRQAKPSKKEAKPAPQ
jgi:hypothetical protein